MPLGDLADVQLGKMLSPKAKTGTTSFPYLRNVNVQWDHIDFSNLVEMDFDERERAKFSLQKNDLIVCEGGEPGRCSIIESSVSGVFFQKALMRVRAFDDNLNIRFLYHFMRFSAGRGVFTKDGNQATIAHFPAVKLNALQVPLPSPSEQRRIADILDKADAIRRKRKEAMALTDELLRSTFLEMFGDPLTNPKGWRVRPLGELVADTQLGLVRAAAEQSPTLPFPYIRMNAIRSDGHLDLADLSRVDASAAEIAHNALRNGDFLFNTRNSKELVGKAAVFRSHETHLFNNNILRIRFHQGIESDYINAYWQTKEAQRQLEARKAGTTSVFAIYAKSLMTLPVPDPPPKVQSDFAKICAAAHEQLLLNARYLHAADALFDSLVERAFSGGLGG